MIELVFSDRDNAGTVAEFIKRYKPNFPVGIVDGEFFVRWSQLTPEMRPTVPIVFIIDRNGYIQAQYMGADPMMEERYVNDNLRAKLLQYLPRSAAPAKAKPGAKKAVPKSAPAKK